MARVPLALLALTLSLACGAPSPPAAVDWMTQCEEDLGLTAAECETARGFRLPEALPPSRGNRFADDPGAARLGHRIFFDPEIGRTDASCATCHQPAYAFAQDAAVAEILPGRPGLRNVPSLLTTARNDGFWLWDGAADSLWSQPLFAIENPIEMDGSRLALAQRMASPTYRADYEAVFGPLPDVSDPTRFPRAGAPGDVSWDGMNAADQDLVNGIAANVGKALEAYLRRIQSGPSRMDRYLDGERDALDAEEREGFARFVETCASCHYGPMLTDDTFHRSQMEMVDRGRATGVMTLLANPFNAFGPYSDPPSDTVREPLPLPDFATTDDEMSFRTPTMRNVTLTAPYTHHGGRTLDDILTVPAPLYREGDEVVITAFLEALVGAPPPAEWSGPPMP
jgi:cytochrome c peroxidase